MKTMKLFIASVALAALSFGQTALSTTTLGAAITSVNTTSVTLASTSTMLSAGPQNNPNTCLYIDKELFGVVTVVDSTHVTVQQRGRGCGAIGASARPALHANGALVYFANTANSNTNFPTNAASLIGKNYQPTGETVGSCTATNELSLPRIYIFSGDIYDCKNGSSGGQWIQVASGAQGISGYRISTFCTGTTGSGETEYLNGAACSGATTATYRYTVTSYGTLANLYISGSANVVSMGSDAVTVYKNGSSTTITCTLASGTKACSDTTHSVAVAPGDYIQVQVVTTASDTLANVSATLGLY